MKELTLDFDQEAVVNISLFKGNYYQKVFHVTKNGVDYDWVNVTDIILLIQKSDGTGDKIELKRSTHGITTTAGYLTLELLTTDTNIEADRYDCVELQVRYSITKPKTWWAGGYCLVKESGVNG